MFRIKKFQEKKQADQIEKAFTGLFSAPLFEERQKLVWRKAKAIVKKGKSYCEKWIDL